MRAVAIVLDGVLRKPLDVEAQDFGANLLYGALSDQFRLVVLGSDDTRRDDHFLLVNGMARHIRVEPDHPKGILGQLRNLRQEGFVFEFVVLADPQDAMILVQNGYSTLLYTHPTFSSPAFRPDYTGGIRSWYELETEVDLQRDALVDKRKQEKQDV